jgi:hypothetical protein
MKLKIFLKYLAILLVCILGFSKGIDHMSWWRILVSSLGFMVFIYFLYLDLKSEKK